MLQMNKTQQSISLTFRGFDCVPAIIESHLGVSALMTGTKGSLINPHREATYRKSFAYYSMDSHDEPLDILVERFVESLGGWENIRKAKESTKPEYLEFNFTFWVRNSDEVMDGSLPDLLIQKISNLGASLGFSFP
jgi:hypothetical protein